MIINKIQNSIKPLHFKGYQHETNDYGQHVLAFNFPYDHKNEDCYVEFFKVKRNDKAHGGYDVIEDECIYRQKLSPRGTKIDIQTNTTLEPEEPFAYRIVKERFDGKKQYVADTGLKLYKDPNINAFTFDHDYNPNANYQYTLVSRTGTFPKPMGFGLAIFPDSLPGFRFAGFNDKHTGNICLDYNLQKEMSETVRTYSNVYGGNLAGLIEIVKYMNDINAKILFTNPFANGDDRSSHHYWNKNNFRIANSMGNLHDFKRLTQTLFQYGKKLIFDYTLTGESIEGIDFQYAMRWKGYEPETEDWYRSSDKIIYGIIPNNAKNLRFKVVNPLEIYEQQSDGKISIFENPRYDSSSETYIQVYDNSQVSDSQKYDTRKRIDTYDKITTTDELAINSHDDTIVPFAFEIDPELYSKRLHYIKDLIDKGEYSVSLDSEEGAKMMLNFDTLKIGKKIETGTVNFDANTDLIKRRHDISAFDEKAIFGIKDFKDRIAKRKKMEAAVNQNIDLDRQVVRYWTQLYQDNQILYIAKTLGDIQKRVEISNLIKFKLLPSEVYLNEQTFKNIKNNEYLLKNRNPEDSDLITINSLMSLPLRSLEIAENTLGVLGRSYFSNLATKKEHVGLTRFQLMQLKNPHLTKETEQTYTATNNWFINDIKNFADKILLKVDQNSYEKLFYDQSKYTEYGEYIINLVGQDIARYALLKAIGGENCETKILDDGSIVYNIAKLEESTSLKKLGITESTPKREAIALQKRIERGLKTLNEEDVNYLAYSISKIIKNTSTLGFKLADAMVNRCGLGLAARFDAAKDVMDNDSVRDFGNSVDDNITKIINYYKQITSEIKKIDKYSPTMAEFTDMNQLHEATYHPKSQVYGKHLDKVTGIYKNVPDAMSRIFTDSGLTTEAAYSYFFTDLEMLFSQEFEKGLYSSDHGSVKSKIAELIRTRNIDYIRNLYTFLSNHDKTRIVHALTLSQPLFYSDFKYSFSEEGAANFAEKRNHREAAALVLTGAKTKEELPIEARLNIDNPDYFKRISSEAISMAILIKDALNETDIDTLLPPQDINKLHESLKYIASGVYQGKGNFDDLNDSRYFELTSLLGAMDKIIEYAEKNHNLKINAQERDDFIRQTAEIATREDLVSKYRVHGDFDWGAANSGVGEENRKLAQSILDKDLILSANSTSKAINNDKDYQNYSLYVANLIGLLREAMLETEIGKREIVQSHVLAGMKDFFEKYNRETVEKGRCRSLVVDNKQAERANSFAAKNIETAIKMVLKQVNFETDKRYLDEKEIIDKLHTYIIAPAVAKMQTMTRFLAALLGQPFIYFGDEMGVTGGERKARNLDLQSRNAIPLHWRYERNSEIAEFAKEATRLTNEAIGLRANPDAEAISIGTPYELNAVSINGKEVKNNFPAYLTQAANGDTNIVVMNSNWIKPDNKVVYDENAKNKYIPVQTDTEIDYIEFLAGVALPAGTIFTNIIGADKKEYIVENVKDNLYRLVNKVKTEKITLSKITAPNGVFVLKKYAPRFKGRNKIQINKQYNIVSNPYKNNEIPIEGEKLSIVSR